MKYFVIAFVWSNEKNAVVKKVVGAFENYICAAIFSDGYNEHYSAKSYIVEADTLLN